MTIVIKKQSYTIPCSSAFRDIVIKLAEDRSVNVADLVRSVLLVLPEDIIKRFPDPGEPEAGDREKTIVKTGPSKGRPWRRKPRLQVRLTPGYEVPFVRRAFNIAVVLDDNLYSIRLQKSETVSNYDLPKLKIDAACTLDNNSNIESGLVLKQMHEIIAALSFTPLPEGLSNKIDALHVMGFFPSERPNKAIVQSKFRLLAQIHHPDSNYGDHNRMVQLNAALHLLNA